MTLAETVSIDTYTEVQICAKSSLRLLISVYFVLLQWSCILHPTAEQRTWPFRTSQAIYFNRISAPPWGVGWGGNG